MTTIRQEIRAIVEDAKRAGKPVTGQIIWGLLSRDVVEDSFVVFLHRMCKDGQLRALPGDPSMRRGGRTPLVYDPGDAVVDPKRAAKELISSFMGFREHARLEAARAAARAWAASERSVA